MTAQTGCRLGPVVKLWNDLGNLNNTAMRLNRSKGDAFEVWKDGRESNLRDALLRYNVAANHRARICVAFEETVDDLCCGLDEVAEKTECDVYSDLAAQLADWKFKTG